MSLIVPHESIDRAIADFRNDAYLRINARRLEHLASLNLPIRGKRVLEIGAGIGDLTSFFLDRGCEVMSLEGRQANASVYSERFSDEPRARVEICDLNEPPTLDERFDVVFAYGVLYHLSHPDLALEWMCDHCGDMLLLSTCVTPHGADGINPTHEPDEYASQALDGRGCRPSRAWVYDRLSALMPHVYTTVTQPNHDEFPLDWGKPAPSRTGLHRAVFVASRERMINPLLVEELPQSHEPGG